MNPNSESELFKETHMKRNKGTCNYCIYCIFYEQEYRCRFQFENYIVEKTNPKCEDYIEAETTALQNNPFSIPRRAK